ncbi:MAG TPA: hypothetical protein VEC37_03715 [Bacillota bacterium]|nr:hypothetical protein [Bacillota bacterium]
MTNDKGSPQKMVSTPTLIILVVGLAILGYMLLQPMFAPEDSGSVPEQPAVDNQAVVPDSNNSPVQNQTVSNSKTLPIVKNGAVSERDPFLPSALILAKAEPSKPEPLPIPEIKPEPPKKTEPIPTPKADTANLTWKGLVGAEAEQIVMIQRNNRTYTLRLGDLLPGTQYILSEVTHDSVLLISPAEQKRLYKKKEAKKNG